MGSEISLSCISLNIHCSKVFQIKVVAIEVICILFYDLICCMISFYIYIQSGLHVEWGLKLDSTLQN
jgi:hypothetical protein